MEGDWPYLGSHVDYWSLDAVVRQGFRGLSAPVAPPQKLWSLPVANNKMQAATADPFPAFQQAAPQPSQQLEPPPVVPVVVQPSSGGGPSLPPNKKKKKKKKRKRADYENSEKKTVEVVRVQDFAGSDMWAWRKYGDKLIKGFRFPRAYYRCSSDETACPARKTTDVSVVDQNLLVITYVGEHNHDPPPSRNVLACTNRRKAGDGPSSRRPELADQVGGSSSSLAPPPPAPVPLQDVLLFPPVKGSGQGNLTLPVPEGMTGGASHGTVSEAGTGPEPALPNNLPLDDDMFFIPGWGWESPAPAAPGMAASRKSQ